MLVNTLTYDRERYNSLPDVETADKTRKDASSVELAMLRLKSIFVKYNMNEKWGLSLLHNHWHLDSNELPIQETISSISPMEFESAPRGEEFTPPIWPMTLAVDCDRMRFTALEFTADSSAMALDEDLWAKPEFVTGVCEELTSCGLAGVFGLIALKARNRAEFELIEYNPGGRKSILRERLLGDVAMANTVETCWRVPLMEAETDCEASCFARCFVTDSGHTGDHAPAHGPGA